MKNYKKYTSSYKQYSEYKNKCELKWIIALKSLESLHPLINMLYHIF